ncbi:amidase family protein [Streptomyces sp. INA 01156]
MVRVVGLKVTNGRLPSPDRTGLAAPGVLTRTAADAVAWWRAVSPPPTAAEVPPSGPRTAIWSPTSASPIPTRSPSRWPEPRSTGSSTPESYGSSGPREPRAPYGRTVGGASAASGPAPAWLALRAPAGPADLAEAHRVREANDRRLARLFAHAELLLTPTAPTAPHGHEGPGDVYSTALTWAFNVSGHPALSLPAGFGSDGCPAGLQLVAPHGREALLLAVARAAEPRPPPSRSPRHEAPGPDPRPFPVASPVASPVTSPRWRPSPARPS